MARRKKVTSKKTPKLLERVVVGPKSYFGIDPKTGNRKTYGPGSNIMVTQAQARAFPHRLADPKVIEAQEAAKKAADEAAEAASEAVAEAEAEAEEVEVEVETETSSDKGSDSDES